MLVLCPVYIPPTPDWAEDFTSALLAARISRKEAAILMDMSEAQLSRALAGVPGANIFLRRMAKLPETFQREYGIRLALRYGLPERFVRGAHLALVVLLGSSQKRMAQMGLTVPQKQECAL